MTREITPAAITASEDAVVRPIVMVDLDFESGHVRSHSGVGTVNYNGNAFLGVGNLGRISAIEENMELQASGLVLTISGVDSSNISTALGETYQGREAIIYLGLLNESHQLIDDPIVLFRGRMDSQTISLGKQGTINLTVENPLADWDRVRIRRYNNEDQQLRYPGDKGLEFVEKAVNQEIRWGQ